MKKERKTPRMSESVPIDVLNSALELSDFVLGELLENMFNQKPIDRYAVKSSMAISKLLKTLITNEKERN